MSTGRFGGRGSSNAIGAIGRMASDGGPGSGPHPGSSTSQIMKSVGHKPDPKVMSDLKKAKAALSAAQTTKDYDKASAEVDRLHKLAWG